MSGVLIATQVWPESHMTVIPQYRSRVYIGITVGPNILVTTLTYVGFTLAIDNFEYGSIIKRHHSKWLRWISKLSQYFMVLALHPYLEPLCLAIPAAIHIPDSKVHGANMGPTWVMSVPDWPRVGPIHLLSGMYHVKARIQCLPPVDNSQHRPRGLLQKTLTTRSLVYMVVEQQSLIRLTCTWKISLSLLQPRKFHNCFLFKELGFGGMAYSRCWTYNRWTRNMSIWNTISIIFHAIWWDYMFSAYPILLWLLWEYVCFIFFHHRNGSFISHRLGSGHETMLCAVCVAIYNVWSEIERCFYEIKGWLVCGVNFTYKRCSKSGNVFMELGPISRTIFPSQSEFDVKLVLVLLHCRASYRFIAVTSTTTWMRAKWNFRRM